MTMTATVIPTAEETATNTVIARFRSYETGLRDFALERADFASQCVDFTVAINHLRDQLRSKIEDEADYWNPCGLNDIQKLAIRQWIDSVDWTRVAETVIGMLDSDAGRERA